MRRIMFALFAGCLIFAGCSKEAPQGHAILFDGRPAVYSEHIYDNGVRIGQIVEKQVSPAGNVRLMVVFNDDWLQKSNENIVFYPRHGHLQVEYLQGYGPPLPPDAVLCGFTSRNGLIWFNVKTLISDRAKEARKKARDLQARFGTS